MSENAVIFNIHCNQLLLELKIKYPKDVSTFIGDLKDKLNLATTDKLKILYPAPTGKMMEIKTDHDLELLMKTKHTYYAVNNEIHYDVELVVITIYEMILEDELRAVSRLVLQVVTRINILARIFKISR